MKNQIDRIVIVGGGTAGWIAAAHLARHFQIEKMGTPEITLIESEEIGRIGVGEATVPSIRNTLEFLGIDEFEFMRETSATFKQAIKFNGWQHNPDSGQPDSFYHTFQMPFRIKNASPLPYWLKTTAKQGQSYVDYAVAQGKVCDAGLAPYQYRPGVGKQQGLTHAFHFDANLFAHFLKSYSVKRGVKHMFGNVEGVVQDENGDITYLCVKDQESLGGDLFIDCTGFAAHLIEKKMGSEFRSLNPVLFCDAAVTMQVPYNDPRAPIRPFTTATAQENGWTWDIGLNTRRGIGYVYSSRHTTADRAEEVLRNYIGPASMSLVPRHLPMRVGYRAKQWVGNCIALGLSAGFLEPLESTGIAQVTSALNRLSSSLSLHGSNGYARDQFNKNMVDWFDLVIEIIKMHYCLTKRTDTAFWRENTDPETIPDRLKGLLEAMHWRPMNIFDNNARHSVFADGSYEQIFVGMGHLPNISGNEDLYPYDGLAAVKQANISKQTNVAIDALPTHRSVIDKINAA